MKLDIQLFSSTNKTEYYELSQYVASDKPTYLVDYNDDMEAIDTAIHGAKTQADLGVTNAGIAQTTAENAQTTANTAVTNASTAQTTADSNTSKIGNLANLATINKSDLVSAISEVKNENSSQAQDIQENTENIAKFNLSNVTRYASNQMTIDSGSINAVSYINVATNNDGSIAKIYGTIIHTKSTAGNALITITGTNLRPSEEITINGGIVTQLANSTIYTSDIIIKPNGTLQFSLTSAVRIRSAWSSSAQNTMVFAILSVLFRYWVISCATSLILSSMMIL